MNKLKLFETELDYIQNPNIREFAEYLIENADLYFFFIPASTSGKYHPEFDLNIGGLVRHTKVVAFMAYSLGTAHMLEQNLIDMLVVAAIAHDIKKIGSGASGRTLKNHPQLAADWIRDKYAEKPCELSADTIDKICDCVSTHMGQWGENKPTTELELILHSADYIASRKDLKAFDFKDMPEIDPTEIGGIAIPFGKYKGKTIREVLEQDSSYYRWAESCKDFFNPTYQNLMIEYKKSTEPKINFEL